MKVAEKQPCGECHACCVHLDIDDLEKPKGEPCVHLKDGRCSIYEERPKDCSGWGCMHWLGLVGPELRPDRCGVIIAPAVNNFAPDAWGSTRQSCGKGRSSSIGPLWCALRAQTWLC